MDLMQSRKTPAEAYGVRSKTLKKSTLDRQRCTCRSHRPLGGTVASQDHSDEDLSPPHTTNPNAAGMTATMNSSTGRSGTGSTYCAQCAMVYSELQHVDNAVRHRPARAQITATAAPVRAGGATSGGSLPEREASAAPAVMRNAQLMGSPFTGSAESAPRGVSVQSNGSSGSTLLLAPMRRVQEAAQWLAQCPLSTLRTLQQHTLCHLEGYIVEMIGIPAYMQLLIPTNSDADAGSGKTYDDGIDVPEPLDLRTFLAEFLVVDEADRKKALGDSTAMTSSSPGHRLVLLPTGRPLPAAPVSSVDLPYGSFLIEEALSANAGDAATAGTPQPLTDPRVLADGAEWQRFFATYWDPAKEAQCRDPVGLFCSILLACSEAGERQRKQRMETVMSREVAKYCAADDSHVHRHTCCACQARQARIRNLVEWQCVTQAPPSASRAVGVRLFLRTPAVVLWVASFLQQSRMTFGAQQHAAGLGRTVSIEEDKKDCEKEREDGTGLLDTDVVPAGEAYLLRDWLLAAIQFDTQGFQDQQDAGTLRTTTSSASNAPIRRVFLRKDELLGAMNALSAWMDENVRQGRGLRARVFLHTLRESFPVTAYYFSFFAA